MKRYVKASTVKDDKIPRDEQVRICIEFINYLGEVDKSHEVAIFRGINWAKPVIKDIQNRIKQENSGRYDNSGVRYRIEFSDGRKAYITSEGDNEFANSL